MLKRDLEADKRLCEATTPEKWIVDGSRVYAMIGDEGMRIEAWSEERAKYIADACEAWPYAIDRAIAAEKRIPDPVELPPAIEDAILVCLNYGLSRISIITNMDQTSYLIRDGSISQQIIHALTIVSKYARQTAGGGQDLLNALANWYEVKDERWVKRVAE